MIEVIRNIDELELIKESINQLADNFKMPLLRYEWLKNTAITCCPPGKLNFIILKENDEITAVAPLVIVSDLFSERLEIIGTSVHKEPGGFLYKNSESLNALIEEIINLEKPVFIKGIKIFSSLSFALESLLKNKKKYCFVTGASIPFLPISESWESFQKRISSSRRSSFRRLERIGREMGELTTEIVTPSENEVDGQIEEVFNVEASGWKGRTGTAMKLNSGLGIFFKNYSRDAARLGILRICFLRINSKAIAAQIGVVYANRFWSLKIGYDENWSKCSPGILLMNEMIRYAFDNRLEAVEFLGSDESWLHIWTNHTRRLITYRIFSSPVSSTLNLFVEYSGSMFRKIRYHFVKSLMKEQPANVKV